MSQQQAQYAGCHLPKNRSTSSFQEPSEFLNAAKCKHTHSAVYFYSCDSKKSNLLIVFENIIKYATKP